MLREVWEKLLCSPSYNTNASNYIVPIHLISYYLLRYKKVISYQASTYRCLAGTNVNRSVKCWPLAASGASASWCRGNWAPSQPLLGLSPLPILPLWVCSKTSFHSNSTCLRSLKIDHFIIILLFWFYQLCIISCFILYFWFLGVLSGNAQGSLLVVLVELYAVQEWLQASTLPIPLFYFSNPCIAYCDEETPGLEIIFLSHLSFLLLSPMHIMKMV